jgi:hypothetical protein
VTLSLVCGLLGLGAEQASAYVRSRTRSCRVVFWPQSCVYIQPDGDLLGPDMPDGDVETAIQNAIKSWNDHLNISSFMQLRYLPPSGPKEVNPLDGLQLIKFRRDRWCRPPTATDSMTMCMDQSATAITTVTFINRPNDPLTDGTIIDADIDFNAVNFHFYDASGPPPMDARRPPIDLWNTVTHELGHVMGLEHTCVLSSPLAACVVDDQGRPVPDCSMVDFGRDLDPRLQTIYEATMYPSAVPGETSKRVPHADDVAGIVNAYPKVLDPMTCRLPLGVTEPSCAASPHLPAPRSSLLWFSAVASGLLGVRLLARRRRRSRRSAA